MAAVTPEQLAANPSESSQQKALFAWAAIMHRHNPSMRLNLLFAIPNGGKRDMMTAARLKAEGVKSGVPDLMWPLPWHGYAGLFVEMKAANGRVDAEQKQWIAELAEVGYAVTVAWSYEAAKTAVLDYAAGRRVLAEYK